MKYKSVSYPDFERVKKMSLNNFRRWVESVYESGLADGLEKAREDVVIDLTPEELLEALLAVKGIGRKRAEEVVTKIVGESDGCQD